MRYYYRGPIYRFEHTPVEDIEFYTEATSKAQAINNFKSKAKKYLGLAMTAKVDIKTENVVIADDFDDFDPFEEPKKSQKCEICGTQLTDGGECPVCDLGDEIINENINRWDDSAQLITDIMKTRFGEGVGIIRSYLLPDGTFLSTDYGQRRYNNEKSYQPHYSFENFLGNFVFGYLGKHYDSWNNYDEEEKEKIRREYGIDDKDIQEIYDYIEDNYGWEDIGEKADQAGCPFFENEFGWIRLNGGVDGEKYIVIPSIETIPDLSSEQYKGLQKWLDRFYIDEITVTLPDSAYDWDEVRYNVNNETDTVDYIIKRIKRYYNSGHLDESKTNLTEATRNQLISKSRAADQYKNGGNRWLQKSKCSVANAVKDYNKIDMDSFWKKDQLSFGVKVAGETDSYLVTIQLNKILEKLEREVKANKNKLDPKIIYRALFQAMNGGDVLVSCTCLHPSTKIKLLDGTTPTIEEMQKRFESGEKLYVYSVDEKGDFKPGEVEKVWKTKTTKTFVKVTLDNGEEIMTTPDHPYMLRDGTYCLAENLKEGTSLMPMYFNTAHGYETVKFNSKERRWQSVYKLVADYFKSREISEALERNNLQENPMNYAVAIHHIDFNKNNNNPENLQVMTGYEHWNYHANLCGKNRPITNRMREASRENALKRNANPTEAMIKQRQRWQNAGKTHNQVTADHSTLDYQKQAEVMSEAIKNYWSNASPDELKRRSDNQSTTNRQKWAEGCFNTEKFKEARKREGKRLLSNLDNQRHMREGKMLKVLQKMIDQKIPLTEENYELYRNRASKATALFDSFNDMISYFKLNHKISKVETIILDETPVYDIKVKKWENFVVAAGVVLHNCPDYRFRLKYWNSQQGNEAGEKETRAANMTNPNDTKGAACKHILMVLNNLEWLNKIASVINNYINYCKDNMEYNYSRYMFPKIYGMPYQKAVQIVMDDYDENGEIKDTLKSDEATINLSNALGAVRGRIQKGSNKNPVAQAAKQQEK